MKQLWQHQEEAIAKLARAFQLGSRSNMVVSPMGTGKNILLLTCAKRHIEKGGKVVLAVPRDELVLQATEAATDLGISHGVVAASGVGEHNPYRPLQICNSHTLIARGTRPECSLFMIDECHHAPADELSNLVNHYKSAGKYIIAATATPSRGDGRGFGDLFDNLIVAITTGEAVKRGILVPCNIIAPKQPLDSNCIAQSPVVAYQKYANGRTAIAFGRNRKAAEDYAEQFNSVGISAVSVTGNDNISVRRQKIKDYKSGKYKVLTNCLIATEGFDHKSVECCILARSCGTQALFLQIVGRVLRTSPETNKKDALLIDLYGSSHIHGHPEEDRIFSLHGEAIRLKDDKFINPYRFCPICQSLLGDNTLCLDCGFKRPEIEAPEIVNAPLFKFERYQKDDIVTRTTRLAKFMKKELDKGNSIYRAKHIFKGTYNNEVPSKEMWANALRLLDEELNGGR